MRAIESGRKTDREIQRRKKRDKISRCEKIRERLELLMKGGAVLLMKGGGLEIAKTKTD